MTGTIFDIKEFSVHDGPGPRVTVFFKGCPLRCQWCHNPEGLLPAPQLLWKRTLCTGCGACRVPCGHLECQPLGRCCHRCIHGALSLSGRTWELDALAARLLGYGGMLRSMGGGVTLSGGEPLYQWEFAAALLERLRGVHRAIQTSGFAEADAFRAVLAETDYVMMDVKLADPAQHRRYTGVDNAQILRNLRILQESGTPHLLRTPLIPGITDTEENLRAVAALAGESPVELLEYNRFAPAKYGLLEQEFPLPDLPAPNPVDLGWFRDATLSKL
ncbi:MAG: glycyl-radical enzyme activating protein [Oscillospiraceae bacterium]|nr:glycyl-radical enzyme activating protein [Oscillospiraceae bacterium]